MPYFIIKELVKTEHSAILIDDYLVFQKFLYAFQIGFKITSIVVVPQELPSMATFPKMHPFWNNV